MGSGVESGCAGEVCVDADFGEAVCVYFLFGDGHDDLLGGFVVEEGYACFEVGFEDLDCEGVGEGVSVFLEEAFLFEGGEVGEEDVVWFVEVSLDGLFVDVVGAGWACFGFGGFFAGFDGAAAGCHVGGSPFGWLDGGHSEGFGVLFEDEFVDAVEVDFLYYGVVGDGVFAEGADDGFNVISVPACVGSADVLLVEFGVLVG